MKNYLFCILFAISCAAFAFEKPLASNPGAAIPRWEDGVMENKQIVDPADVIVDNKQIVDPADVPKYENTVPVEKGLPRFEDLTFDNPGKNIERYVFSMQNNGYSLFEVKNKKLFFAGRIQIDQYEFNQNNQSFVFEKNYTDEEIHDFIMDFDYINTFIKNFYFKESAFYDDEDVINKGFMEYARLSLADRKQIKSKLLGMNFLYNLHSCFLYMITKKDNYISFYMSISLKKHDVLWFNWGDHYKYLRLKIASARWDNPLEDLYGVHCDIFVKKQMMLMSMSGNRLKSVRLFKKYKETQFVVALNDFLKCKKIFDWNCTQRIENVKNIDAFLANDIQIQMNAIRNKLFLASCSYEIQKSTCILSLEGNSDSFTLGITFIPLKDK